MKRLTLYSVGLLATFALGWTLHRQAPGNVTPSGSKLSINSPQTIALRAFSELLGYYQRKDMQLTARNRSLVDSLKVYQRHTAELLIAQQRAETIFVHRDTGITPDSVAHLCYAVVRLCEIRADSAIAQRDRYAKALDAQLGLQPHRFGITLGVGPTFVLLPKRAWGLGANLSLSFRLW